MKKCLFLISTLILFCTIVISQETAEQNLFIKNRKFNEISLEKIFETDKAVFGLGDLRFVSISYDDKYLGMYFIDPLVKTFKYKLFRIVDNNIEEVDLEEDMSPVEYMDCSIGFSKDSKQFYTLTTNMEIYIWSVETGNLLKKIKGRDRKEMKSPYAFVNNGQFHYDKVDDNIISNGFIVFGDYLYSFDGTVASGFSNSAAKLKLNTSPTRIAFSKNNKFIAVSGLFSKKADIYNIEKGELIRTIKSTKKPINSICFVPKNQSIVMSEKGAMSIGNFNNSESKKMFVLDKRCYTMDINFNNLLVYAESPKYKTKIWDLNKNKLLSEIPSPFKITYELVLSYDGSYIYAVSARGQVISWEITYN